MMLTQCANIHSTAIRHTLHSAGEKTSLLFSKLIIRLLLVSILLAGSLSTAYAESKGTFIWQGFDHEWRRFVILPKEGRVPHRISRLASFIHEQHYKNQRLTGEFTMAQSTGVDGNYMRPQGFFSGLTSTVIGSHQGVSRFSWTDQIEGNEVPLAESSYTNRITIEIPISEGETSITALLNGIELAVSCDNEKQPQELPCNSDGLWPYDFYIGFGHCEWLADTEHTAQYSCPLSLTLNRGWTPNLGGLQIPPFFEEIKPLNQRLDIEFKVHYVILSGNKNQFMHKPIATIATTQSLQNPEPAQGIHTLSWQSPDASDSQKLLTAIRGFGFELNEPILLQPLWHLVNSDTRQRGRYIAKLNFQVANPTLSHDNQLLSFAYANHVWSPITVVDSFVTTRLDTTLLAFATDTDTSEQNKATGRLCINSTDQAPAFSRWHQCSLNYWWARLIYGSPQSMDSVRIKADF